MLHSWLLVSTSTSAANGEKDVATAGEPNSNVPTDPNEPRELWQRAHKGDESTLPALREMLKTPHWIEAWGNLAKHVENALIRKCAAKNLALIEGLHKKLEIMRGELAGPASPPLESLLAERIVTCWLHLNFVEMIFAGVGKDGASQNQAMIYQKCIDRAHRRYLSAIKTLATVRKLALPVLQVNIAEKQVNVAGPCLPAEGTREVV
jgi:hypothetical protein